MNPSQNLSNPSPKTTNQSLYECFVRDVELRVYSSGVQMHVKRHLKQLEGIFYGACLSYDTVLSGTADAASGASLPDALLRNVYGGAEAARPAAGLAARYLLQQAECLALTPSADLLAGRLAFWVDVPAAAAAGKGV